jgi:glutamyl-tRNA synthetase
LDARSIGAELVLRIEDLDTPRTKSWASEQIIEDLTWLGLDWDLRAPDASQRCDRYTGILDRLRCEERIYPCVCTRSEIEASASAPHETVLDGAIYPGTCRALGGQDAALLHTLEKPFAWRFPFPPGWQSWVDLRMGPQALDPSQQLGDFIVARSYGPIAYQLAVVVDDHDQGVSRVLRGDDLVYSTFRQLALYNALGWTPPDYMHLPLVVGPDGKRLAKRHGDTRLSTLREQNVAPERLIGYLAWSLGWMPSGCSISAKELLEQLKNRSNWQRDLPTTPWVFRIEDL